MPSIAPNTRTRFRPRIGRAQQGQAIVLIALLILVLFGMLGLAIDSGRAYVDRRDQQTAVDAAALAAGDWYENYSDLTSATYGAIPHALQLYENDVRQYSAGTLIYHPVTQFVGPNGNLPKDEWTYSWGSPVTYTLDIVSINTQFNGYEFDFTSTHNLPLAFIQIFGGSPVVTIQATATAIVGNQRQTPALLTLSTGDCATKLTGSAQLTVLGDVYTNGTACLDSNLHEAGNCYAAAGNCNVAQYYCYNSTPGFVPYPPPCNFAAGDTQGGPIVPAPTLPDPGYLATAATSDCSGASCFPFAGSYNQWNRGSYTEMPPGVYGTFHLTGGSASCAFLDPGVYTWTGGYSADATGSFLSNELKPPDEPLYSDPNVQALANPQFWNQNGTNCWGQFNIQTVPAPGFGIKHQGGSGNWGIELTSIRYDRFVDPQVSPNPCYASPGCRRESAPSACQSVGTIDGNNQGIAVNITQNAPGAQYYGVYVDPYGCETATAACDTLCIQAHFGFWGRFVAPGFANVNPPAVAVGPWPNGSNVLLPGPTGQSGWSCPLATATICNIAYNQLVGTYNCYSQTHAPLCTPPDLEGAPQCFSNCPPPANLLSQENAPMSLEYPPYSGGDLANENYCQPPPNPGDPTAPCQGSQITPGGVQFYFPPGACFSQNAQGATYVYAGLQFNWIVIYAPPSNTCNETLNGGASTQYIGTIYTPGANWQINGSDRSPLAGQVICYTAVVSGGGQAGIDFNPNYSPTPPAARLIN